MKQNEQITEENMLVGRSNQRVDRRCKSGWGWRLHRIHSFRSAEQDPEITESRGWKWTWPGGAPLPKQGW